MDDYADSLFKEREIVFQELHPDPDQAGRPRPCWSISRASTGSRPSTAGTLQVAYHLLAISLAEIEQLLEQSGFHLDNRLVYKIRRALHHYTEETQRANLGCAKGEANCTQKVFVNRYRQREHGCQDDRPDHWRRYL